jgi:DNA-binding response OmpR family regulator
VAILRNVSNSEIFLTASTLPDEEKEGEFRADAHAPYIAGNAMHHFGLSNAAILLIDDEAETLTELAETLSRSGFSCRCAKNAATARELALRSTPDLIISDINLDGQSGLELCASLKDAHPSLADVPVIFLSAAQIPHIVRRAREAGGTYYVRKPVDPEVLIELVDKALWMPHLVSHQTERTRV